MKRQKAFLLSFVAIFTSLSLGGVCLYCLARKRHRLASGFKHRVDISEMPWSDEFSLVNIRSSSDEVLQPAYFLAAPGKNLRPLVVSLHTWSGDYSQYDPLAQMARDRGWNYIHPDFRGPNSSRDSCLSRKTLSDIDDAIQYAIDEGRVDSKNIFVVGLSGGGHAALGLYSRTRHKIKAFLAWSPISDLVEWHGQAEMRNLEYAHDIVQITSQDTFFKPELAAKRSPLFWNIPLTQQPGKLEIYAGINDGYEGPVPISHSILFYNRIIGLFGYNEYRVTQTDIVKLLTRSIEKNETATMIGDRKLIYRRDTERVSLVIFDGAHEILPEYCFDRMKQIAEQDRLLSEPCR